MAEMLQRLENAVHQRRLLPRGQKLLVAVSGGADSMVLLHTLNLLAPKFRWKISIAHFNHQLRGRASLADENLVRRTAEKMALPFFCECGEVAGFACQSKISVEMAARKLRHKFLARVARASKIKVIALAHHADDQVELFFLRLLRGAGGEGLAGMKWRSPSPAGKQITLVRPLLDCSKAELLAFARESKIVFRDDASNLSTDFLRNRIRNELLPLLQKNYQPGLMKTVLRSMEIVGAEAGFVSDVARQWLDQPGRSRGDESPTKIGKRQAASGKRSEPPHVVACNFEELPLAVQRKVLQLQLTKAGVISDFELIEQLRGSAGKFVSVNDVLAVARDMAGKLCRQDHRVKGFSDAELKFHWSGRAGRVAFGDRKFGWKILLQPKIWLPQKRLAGETPAPRREFFDVAKVGDEIILRHWRPGDRFQPIGMKSAAKLQDLLVNAKIPARRRRELVLATTAAGAIFWVEGLRIGEQFKLTPETKRQLLWSWNNSPASTR